MGGILATGMLALPAVATLTLAFSSGGFFPGATGRLAAAVAILAALLVVTLKRPLAGLSRGLALASLALIGLAAWTLLSATWSDAPGRSIIEFDRTLLYALATVVCGLAVLTADRLRWMAAFLTVAFVAVAGVALVTRLWPDVWPLAKDLAQNRLSYPISYWNGLGLICAAGTVFCFHFSSDPVIPRAGRIAAAAALPIPVTALYLTLSQASIAAAVLGLVAYLLLSTAVGLLGAALAALPLAPLIAAAYSADRLTSDAPTTRAAVDQGHRVALAVFAAAILAAILRAVGTALERRVAQAGGLSPGVRRAVRTAGVALLVVVGIALVAAGPQVASRGPETARTPPGTLADNRAALTEASRRDRVELWEVALDGFLDRPVNGLGAGAFANRWNQHRPSAEARLDAHSLFVEMLAELGIVGFGLVVAALTGFGLGVARRARGKDRPLRDRPLFVAVGSAVGGWVVAASVDWHWELPSSSLWVLCLLGATLGIGGRKLSMSDPSRAVRIVVVLGLIVLAVTPALVARSESHLDRAVEALADGRPERAASAARSAHDALPPRAEPLAVLAYTELYMGESGRSVRTMADAVDRDRRNWELWYALAMVRGAAGLDPRPTADRAVRLNPREPRARSARRAFARSPTPRAWRQSALRTLRYAPADE